MMDTPKIPADLTKALTGVATTHDDVIIEVPAVPGAPGAPVVQRPTGVPFGGVESVVLGSWHQMQVRQPGVASVAVTEVHMVAGRDWPMVLLPHQAMLVDEPTTISGLHADVPVRIDEAATDRCRLPRTPVPQATLLTAVLATRSDGDLTPGSTVRTETTSTHDLYFTTS